MQLSHCTMAKFQWEVFHSEFPTFCQLWKTISLSLSISLIFALNSPCKSYENEQNPYFSDFECDFCLFGGVFYKYHRFPQNNFLAPILAVKNTPFTFLLPPLPVHANFFQEKYKKRLKIKKLKLKMNQKTVLSHLLNFSILQACNGRLIQNLVFLQKIL